jgi:hypothetical protein
MKFVFIILSVLLIVFFLAPWVDLQRYMGVIMSGASIGTDIDKLEPVKGYLRTDDLSFLKISYLLYIIPLSAVVHIVGNLLNKKGWYLRLDYLFSLIATVITLKIIIYLYENAEEVVRSAFPNDFSSWGLKACMYTSIAGLVLQIIYFFFSKKGKVSK